MHMLHLCPLVTLMVTATSTMHQEEFVEKIELNELAAVIDAKSRNLTYEFHELTQEDIDFLLLTRQMSNAIKLNESNLNLVNPNVTTVFIIGGWLQSFQTTEMYRNISKAYFRKGEYNIIIVDIYKVMFFPLTVSMTYIQPSGITVGQFIVKLRREQGVQLNTIHIIGHSMGGNVAGFAGKEVFRITGSKVGRITGLDASLFPFKSLNNTDAEIVVAIHTSALIGVIQPIGTVDFYPNSDDFTLQPGCSLYPSLSQLNTPLYDSYVFCSHHKSYEYFFKTINSRIKARKCRSFNGFRKGRCRNNEVAVFGENYTSGPQGKFYLYLNCTDTNCVSSY